MLTQEDIDSFRDDAEEIRPALQDRTPTPLIASSSMLTLTARAQRAMLRQWQAMLRFPGY